GDPCRRIVVSIGAGDRFADHVRNLRAIFVGEGKGRQCEVEAFHAAVSRGTRVTSGSPARTVRPGAQWMACTLARTEDFTSISIFMDSRTTRGWSALTTSPGATPIDHTLPGTLASTN